MLNKKFLASILFVLAVLFAQVGQVSAAPGAQETTFLTGTIDTITTETDEEGETTVLVTFTDEQGEAQTVRLNMETAVDLFLINPDTLQIDETLIGQTVIIDPTTVLPEEEPTEVDVHPITWLLAEFFFDGDPEMASLIDSFHTGDNDAEQVFGFGVIAQALWMARGEDGADIELAEDILIAKQSKDFETFFEAHPEYQEEFGDEMPTNWGQFKKGLREKKQNLGQIVSGQADETDQAETLTETEEEQGNGQGHGQGRDNGNGRGKDKEKKNKRP
jgi:hypothetical protein